MIQCVKYKSSLLAWLLFLFISLFVSDLYACGNAVTLSWIPPTINANGTPLTDIYGYKIYYGYSPRNYTYVINASNKTVYTLCDLTGGVTYYIAVTAYDISGNESNYSSEVSKLIVPSNGSPTANFAGNVTGGTAPLTVNFTNSTSGGNSPFSYAWDLDNSGGAADSTLQNPSCTYNNKIDGGTYPPYAVRLTVTDSDGDVGAITKTSYISVCYSDVNVIGSSSTYTTMQSAYNAAKDSSTIQSRAVTITENVNFNLPKTITITGGYNCDHSVNTGNTVISGNMTISNGNVTIGNVYLQ